MFHKINNMATGYACNFIDIVETGLFIKKFNLFLLPYIKFLKTYNKIINKFLIGNILS